MTDVYGHEAMIRCVTNRGRIVWRTAPFVHGPFALIRDGDGWRVIHRPSGKGACTPSHVATREAGERLIAFLRTCPVDWSTPEPTQQYPFEIVHGKSGYRIEPLEVTA